MKGEIDKDFYCSANLYRDGKCSIVKVCIPSFGCDCRRRKYPTPEQYKEEYGEDYPDTGAIYYLEEEFHFEGWVAAEYRFIKIR